MTFAKMSELRQKYDLENEDFIDMGDCTDDEAEKMAKSIWNGRTHGGYHYDSIGRRRRTIEPGTGRDIDWDRVWSDCYSQRNTK